MVVHEEFNTAIETADVELAMSKQKSFSNVKNHDRDHIKYEENSFASCNNEENWTEAPESRSTKKKRFTKDKPKHSQQKLTSSDENIDVIQQERTEFSENDLQELRTVYTKCKEVIKKIEKKYGHLLIDMDSSKKRKKRKINSEEEYTDTECTCILNKKIVFDEDGQQSTVEMEAVKHICPKKLKKTDIQPQTKNIEIEFNDNEIKLPDDLRELGCILKDQSIEETYRNKVIDKIRSLRLEYSNEIRFNKHSLVEKLKTHPDELLDFSGTNLASLPGYS